MKWRHWSILIVLFLLNYIIFSTAFTLLAEKQPPNLAGSIRTPKPTFTRIETGPIAWKVLPTYTPCPTKTPVPPTPTMSLTATAESTVPVNLTPPYTPSVTVETPLPTTTAVPTSNHLTIHTVQRDETLSEIARQYGVSVESLLAVNSLSDPNHLVAGQTLIIPVSSTAMPTATSTATTRPPPTRTSTPKPKPPKPTATPTPAKSRFQFTGEVIWDPLVAPNCSGPGISKQSIIRDIHGNPINGARVEINCYGNVWLSHLSGNPGEYEPGHYDFAFGQLTPQDWTCTARVFDVNGQPVASSEVVTIHFDTNDCRPGGSGHQVAIVNWTRHW